MIPRSRPRPMRAEVASGFGGPGGTRRGREVRRWPGEGRRPPMIPRPGPPDSTGPPPPSTEPAIMPKNSRKRAIRREDSRRAGRFAWGTSPLPSVERLEARQLLTVAINEFGGSVAPQNPAGITTGPDGNLWFTEANPLGGAIDRIPPSGAIQRFTTGLSAFAIPTGITAGPDGALWFTEFGAASFGSPFGGASQIGR